MVDCVGIIDGDIIWGFALRAPGQGWRLGELPAFGLWKISARFAEKTGAAVIEEDDRDGRR